MNKIEVIAPIVHAARVAYRQVHAPGKLLPDWGKAEQTQKNEVFAVIRAIEAGKVTYAKQSEDEYLALIASQCFRSLFPEPVTLTTRETFGEVLSDIAEWSENQKAPPITIHENPEPAPRRGRR